MLVFLHGTAIMHPAGVGRTRAERVAQVRTKADPALHAYAAYVPVGGVVAKLRRWQEQGAHIAYLSSHRNPDDVAGDAAALQRYAFPAGPVLAREGGETYGDVAARELPDVLIEDDCESIGGASETTYPQLPPQLRARIRSIIVPEFGGIDHLPDSLDLLLTYRACPRRGRSPTDPNSARDLPPGAAGEVPRRSPKSSRDRLCWGVAGRRGRSQSRGGRSRTRGRIWRRLEGPSSRAAGQRLHGSARSR